MVKTTYALTLFTAVSLAAPVQQARNDAMRRDGSGNLIGAGADGAMNQAIGEVFKDLSPRADGGEHRNLIEDIPVVGKLLGNKQQQQRDMNEHEARSFTGDLSHFPVLGGLFGGNQGHKQTSSQASAPTEGQGHQARSLVGGSALDGVPDVNGLTREHKQHGQNHGQNAGQNEGQNEGQNLSQNGGQNGRRSFTTELSDLSIVGGLLGDKDKDGKNGKKDGKEAEKADHDKRQTKPLKGLTGLLHGLTSGSPVTKSHKRDEMGDISDAITSAESAGIDYATSVIPSRRDVSQDEAQPSQASQPSKPTQSSKSDKPSSPLSELAGKQGLGALFGGAQHGVGLLPMNGRRDVAEVEPRAAPIQGSTLTDVILQGGALGKITKALSPAAPKAGKGADGKGAEGKPAGGQSAQGSQGQASGGKPSGGQ